MEKNVLIEELLSSKWMSVYTNKLNKRFSKYSTSDWNPSKDSLISNLWESLIIYDKKHDLNDEFSKIEKYCFQKAYQLASEEFISDLGKYRFGKQKEWKQTLCEYKDEYTASQHYYGDYPSLTDEIENDTDELTSMRNKALACDFAESMTKSQEIFIKSVMNLGVEATMKNLELDKKTFNTRLNRTVKAIENKKRKVEKAG